jgi:pimeloyl-ACP methyl ester carboxylesterase
MAMRYRMRSHGIIRGVSTPLPEAEPPLYYEEHGAGEPIVLIHGFGASLYSWRYLGPALAQQHRAICIDLQGFGRSPKPAGGKYSIHDHVRMVSDFIRAHDLRGATLIGHSFGGGVALLLALKLAGDATHAPKRLVLIDNVAYRQRLPLFVKILQSRAGALVVRALPAKLLARHVLELAYFDDEKIAEDAVAEYARPLDAQGGRNALVRTARAIIPADIDDLTPRYRDLRIPTLIVWGRQDEIVPIAIGERLHRAIAHSKFLVVERCGHIPHEECPGDAIPAVLEFMGNP